MAIGVLDLLQGCVLNVPRPRKVGAPGPSAAKVGSERSGPPRVNLRQGHGDLVFAMDPVDAFTIIPKNEKFELSINLDFENCFLKKVVNLTTTFLELFCPHRGGHEAL